MVDDIVLGSRIKDIMVRHGWHPASMQGWILIDGDGWYRFHVEQLVRLLNDRVAFCRVKKRKHMWVELLTNRRKRRR